MNTKARSAEKAKSPFNRGTEIRIPDTLHWRDYGTVASLPTAVLECSVRAIVMLRQEPLRMIQASVVPFARGLLARQQFSTQEKNSQQLLKMIKKDYISNDILIFNHSSPQDNVDRLSD